MSGTKPQPAAGDLQTSRRWLPAAAIAILLAAAPFALNLVGDAQVHLAIAEAFATGHPFRFNHGGELVVASTSPFWTAMLVALYRAAGSLTPALLPGVTIGFWLSAAVVLHRSARDLWGFRGPALWSVVLLWLAHTTIVANALGGLENVASALQLLLLYDLLARYRRPSTVRNVLIGLVLGWAMLTRPDGGLLALILFLLALPLLLRPTGNRRRQVAGLFLIWLAAALVLLPWYTYQFAITGRVLTDSSLARLYNGRMGSLVLLPGLLYLHPKALVSLSTAFFPLAAGYLMAAGDQLLRFVRARSDRAALYRDNFPQIAALLLVLAGVAFYTFVVGAEAFGRYFLSLFPFFFLAGVEGLRIIYHRFLAAGRYRTASGIVLLAALFLAATGAIDYYRRLVPGRYSPQSALDVVYGPANLRYYSANVPLLVAAPERRRELTDGFLHDLGRPGAADVTIAVTEVQLRYFLDDRVTVLSLDGRTSARILSYVDPVSGVPDFERYFLDTRPDFVHANQWCEVGGWLASVISSPIDENLVCVWQRQAETMALGDSFDWHGRQVTLVAPEIFRIDWSS